MRIIKVVYKNRTLATLSSKFKVLDQNITGQRVESLRYYDFFSKFFTSTSFLGLPSVKDIDKFHEKKIINWKVSLDKAKPVTSINAKVKQMLNAERMRLHHEVKKIKDKNSPLSENDKQKLNILLSFSFDWDNPKPSDLYIDGDKLCIINWGITNNSGKVISDKKMPTVDVPIEDGDSALDKFKIFWGNNKWITFIPIAIILLYMLFFYNSDPNPMISKDVNEQFFIFNGKKSDDSETESLDLVKSWTLYKYDLTSDSYNEVPIAPDLIKNDEYYHDIKNYGKYKIKLDVADTGNRFTGFNAEHAFVETEFEVLDKTLDCNGVEGGSAFYDRCGVCGGADECVDCNGVPNGGATEDLCGTCDNNPDNDINDYDCLGNPCGSALVDVCGVCGGSATELSECNNCPIDSPADCLGICGGDAVFDECGVCGGEGELCRDCIEDMCGECDDNPFNDCTLDCNGEWGGTAYVDCYGLCAGGSTGIMPAEYDVCGVCDGGVFDVAKCECDKDCAGICDGPARLDCLGVCDGNATFDVCGICEGGETDIHNCRWFRYEDEVEFSDHNEDDLTEMIEWAKQLKEDFKDEIQLPPNSVKLKWPVEMADKNSQFESFGVSVYFDHDERNPYSLEDYDCLSKTYDMPGYNHQGTDIMLFPFSWDYMDEERVQVVSAADGIIVDIHDGEYDKSCGFENAGRSNSVIIMHYDGSLGVYAHFKEGTVINKSIGGRVGEGDVLGFIGSSGMSTGPHLHFEYLNSDNIPTDPNQGRCNDGISRSQWKDERDYHQPAISLVATHNAEPVRTQCYAVGLTNEQNIFYQGDYVYYGAYFRDIGGDINKVAYKIITPEGKVAHKWSYKYNGEPTYYADITPYKLGPYEPLGNWKFIATFDGVEYTHVFEVKPADEKPLIEIEPSPIFNPPPPLSATAIVTEDCKSGLKQDREGNCCNKNNLDCDNMCSGTAYIDNCDECVGGNTGKVECVEDCEGIPGGSKEEDNYGNCCEPYLQDCNSECNGTAYTDSCNNCISGKTGLDVTPIDCAGNCNGSASEDQCGVCNGEGACECPGSSEVSCDCCCDDGQTLDCAGVCGGTAIEDCAGECNGSAVEDKCGICNGPGTIYDCGCEGIPDGKCDCDGNVLDDCGECNGSIFFEPKKEGSECNCDGAVYDCNLECDGSSKRDDCGTCNGSDFFNSNGELKNGECDCEGNIFDLCEDCGGDAQEIFDCIDSNDPRTDVKECIKIDRGKLKDWKSCVEMERETSGDKWEVLDKWWQDPKGNKTDCPPKELYPKGCN